MELINIIYRYINRFICSNELINLIKDIDRNKFNEDEQKELDVLLKDIKDTIDNYPVTEDEFERNRIKTIDNILDKLRQILDSNSNLDDKTRNYLQDRYDSMIQDKKDVRDSGERYEKLYSLLVQNKLFEKYMGDLNDSELLEFITQYIFVPFPPNLSQEEFDKLVIAGIKEDKREALWRMAVNYNYKKINFSKIYNYFIEVRDSYYLTELISAVREDLDIYDITSKVIETKDKDFIMSCYKEIIPLNLFDEEEINKIKEDNKDLIKELFR